jgi:hypothetical protein
VEPSEVISKDDLVVLLANGDDREAAKDVTLSDHCEVHFLYRSYNMIYIVHLHQSVR